LTEQLRPPQPSIGRSPVQFFRELLALSPGERLQKLAERTPESRQVILDKLREYAALKPAECELRLRTTELFWYLGSLMRLGPGDRVAALATIPESERPLVSSRLKLWDQIPAADQGALIENPFVLPYLAQLGNATPAQQDDFLQSLPPERREKIQTYLERMRRLPLAERDRLIAQIRELLGSSPAEGPKVLNGVSEVERQQIIQALGTVAPEKRDDYVRAVRKFAEMSAEERTQFLKNAERWKAMSDEERAAWRALTTKLPPLPPLPPGFSPYERLLPPDPRSAPRALGNPGALQATN
jgi:hypothetical protein